MLPVAAQLYRDVMKNLPVSKIMTRPLVTVSPDEALDKATALMEQRGVHHLLVVEHDRLAGILSSADLLKLALLFRPEAGQPSASIGESLGMRVRDVMQTRVAVVRANSTLREAARALSLGGFHALPVLALNDTPVGIVTSSDLVCLLIDGIERDGSRDAVPPPDRASHAATPGLLEVLRAAEVYLRSGHSDQQHARLTRAVAHARELLGAQPDLN